jgi:hypothetical protein
VDYCQAVKRRRAAYMRNSTYSAEHDAKGLRGLHRMAGAEPHA